MTAPVPEYVLALDCPDVPGIVHAVSGFLVEHGGNIVDLQQHTDESAGVYFQRVEVELEGFDLERDAVGPAFAAIAERCPRGCTHLPDAPDCAMIEAVEAGELGETGRVRLDSLQRLLATFAT